jgi:diacylglycerol kinase family enzyme
MHFQIDGEYKGKVNSVNAEILTDCLAVIVPIKDKPQNKVD